jgi:hypothetical protein
MSGMAIRMAAATIATLATAVVGATVATATAQAAGPTGVNAHCDARLVTSPGDIILYCGDAGTIVHDIRWISWTDTGATGFGTEARKLCVPDCARGKSDERPAMIVLDRPVRQVTGQMGFTHATVRTAAGQESFDIAPLSAQ